MGAHELVLEGLGGDNPVVEGVSDPSPLQKRGQRLAGMCPLAFWVPVASGV